MVASELTSGLYLSVSKVGVWTMLRLPSCCFFGAPAVTNVGNSHSPAVQIQPIMSNVRNQSSNNHQARFQKSKQWSSCTFCGQKHPRLNWGLSNFKRHHCVQVGHVQSVSVFRQACLIGRSSDDSQLPSYLQSLNVANNCPHPHNLVIHAVLLRKAQNTILLGTPVLRIRSSPVRF